jgi:hypothetical protein
MTIKCCCTCDESAIALFTWGFYPNGEINRKIPLCKEHADGLWELAGPSVKALLCHYVIENLNVMF